MTETLYLHSSFLKERVGDINFDVANSKRELELLVEWIYSDWLDLWNDDMCVKLRMVEIGGLIEQSRMQSIALKYVVQGLTFLNAVEILNSLCSLAETKEIASAITGVSKFVKNFKEKFVDIKKWDELSTASLEAISQQKRKKKPTASSSYS